jgi:dTMP kinase
LEHHGKYIVIEGPDGTGKTTHAKLLAETLARDGSKSRYVHEPGETPIGQGLEELIKNPHLIRSPLANFLLFTAARLEAYQQVIQPTLASGGTVVSDRNWLSSVAYQGAAGRVGVERVYEESKRWLPEDYMQPTFTILLYVPSEQRRQMLDARTTGEKDYFESKPSQFQRDLLKGYKAAEKLIIEKGYAGCHVSAGGSIQDVHARIMRHLKEAELI